MSNSRNYGIDLLRLVLMYMICVLHVLGCGGVLGLSPEGSVQHAVYWFLEIVTFCAVNAFAFISGYMATNKVPKTEKIVNMWFQVWFYSFVVTMALVWAGIDIGWSWKDTVLGLLPVSSGLFWYFTAYFVLFFAMPVLNKFLFELDEKASKKVFIFLFVVFSVFGTLRDAFRSEWGYSTIWVVVLYCMGVLARRIKLFESRPTYLLVLLCLGCSLITWASCVFLGTQRLFVYISPTVLGCAIGLVIIFSRIKIKGTIVKKMVPYSFGIYLLQVSPVVWYGLIRDSFSFIASQPLPIGIVCILAGAGLIFGVGFGVEWIRSKLAYMLKVHVLSERIVDMISRNISKLDVFLK